MTVDKNSGYITVEAALIVSVILICLHAITMAILLLYQDAHIKDIAIQTVQSGAQIWRNDSKSFSDGTWKTDSEKGLYSDLIELIGLSQCEYRCLIDSKGEIKQITKEDKSTETYFRLLQAMAEYTAGKLEYGAVRPLSTLLVLRLENGLLKKDISVEINQNIIVPFGMLKKLFGTDSTISLKASAVSSTTEPAAFIRNIDFATELVSSSLPLSFDQIIERIKSIVGRS